MRITEIKLVKGCTEGNTNSFQYDINKALREINDLQNGYQFDHVNNSVKFIVKDLIIDNISVETDNGKGLAIIQYSFEKEYVDN